MVNNIIFWKRKYEFIKIIFINYRLIIGLFLNDEIYQCRKKMFSVFNFDIKIFEESKQRKQGVGFYKIKKNILMNCFIHQKMKKEIKL